MPILYQFNLCTKQSDILLTTHKNMFYSNIYHMMMKKHWLQFVRIFSL